jgi:magnesium-transporting ATPase (P-type)
VAPEEAVSLDDEQHFRSVARNTAVDVAREAADLILLKQDLQVLHDGVREGRRTFANIRKYIMMGTSSNFGNMFSMAGASLFLLFHRAPCGSLRGLAVWLGRLEFRPTRRRATRDRRPCSAHW